VKGFRNILKNRFSYLAYFYGHLRDRVIMIIFLNSIVGVLDGFGLSMFLPLLQMTDSSVPGGAQHMGHLGFLVNFLQKAGFVLNMRVILAVIVSFFILKGIFYYFKGKYQVKMQQFFIREIRLKHIAGLSEMSYAHFVKADIGKIQNSLTGEVDKVSKACQTYFQAFQQGVLVLIYVGFAFAVDWQFAVMVSIGGFFSDLVYRKIYKNTKGISRELSADNGRFQGMIQEFLNSFKYLKATGGIEGYQKKLTDQVESIEKNNSRIGVLSVLLSACREPLSIVVVAIVILIQTAIFHTYLTAILISLLFFYRALGAMMQFQGSWNSFLALSGSLEHLEVFGEELKTGREQSGKKVITGFQREIKCKDIDFEYDGREILRGVSLCISKNETLALVGESGSGKSTLVNLICGLLKPSRGKIEIDGVDFLDADLGGLRKCVGYITQEPVIFNDTIFNNVTLWAEKSDENRARFREACVKAALWDMVSSLPETLDTELGMSGVNLSGGQRQRVSIARELYKKVDLLILDEATSALDSGTEQVIRKSMQLLKGELTLIVIAHRLATVKQADRIVLLEKGRIRQADSFSELMRSSAAFRDMAELQQVAV